MQLSACIHPLTFLGFFACDTIAQPWQPFSKFCTCHRDALRAADSDWAEPNIHVCWFKNIAARRSFVVNMGSPTIQQQTYLLYNRQYSSDIDLTNHLFWQNLTFFWYRDMDQPYHLSGDTWYSYITVIITRLVTSDLFYWHLPLISQKLQYSSLTCNNVLSWPLHIEN